MKTNFIDETAEEAEERAKKEARETAQELDEMAEAGELYSYIFGDEENPDEYPGCVEYLPAVEFTSKANPNGLGLEYSGVEFNICNGVYANTNSGVVEVCTPYGSQTWPLSYDTVDKIDDIFNGIFYGLAG